MKKHLVCYSTKVTDTSALMLDLQGWLYWRKRLKFWEWRLHGTMGRPVLVLRKSEAPSQKPGRK